jgi:hypothetical protein
MPGFAFPSPESPWFIPAFVAMWVTVCCVLAIWSGWYSLATRFSSTQTPEGERFRFASASMGRPWLPVSYGNCLFITVTPTGLALRVLFLFRPLSPPLFIPWSEVASVTERRFLFWRSAVIRFNGHWSHIKVHGSAGQAVLRSYGSHVPAERSNQSIKRTNNGGQGLRTFAYAVPPLFAAYLQRWAASSEGRANALLR